MSIKKRPLVPRCLILDFHDSYTRNLLRLFHLLVLSPSSDARASPAANQLPADSWDPTDWQQRVVVVNVDSLSWQELTTRILPGFDCLILGPGPGRPDRQQDFAWSERLIRDFGHTLPIFGLCLGQQGLASAFGGKIVKAAEPSHGIVTSIHHTGSDALFDGVPSPFLATQYNSLVVDFATVPAELEVIAWRDTVEHDIREVMALKHKERPLWGVQFHPESICSTFGSQILHNFLKLVVRRSNECPSPLPPRILSLSTRLRPGETASRPAASYQIKSVRLPRSRASPQQVFEKFGRVDTLGQIWLDSARPADGPQRSFVCIPSHTFAYDSMSHEVSITHASGSERTVRIENNWTTYMRTLMNDLQPVAGQSPGQTCPIGLVGSLAYESQDALFDGSPDTDIPRQDAHLAFVDRVLAFDHEDRQWTAFGLVGDSGTAEFGLTTDEWEDWSTNVVSTFTEDAWTPPVEPLPLSVVHHLEPDMQHDDYIQAIKKAQSYIVTGESYELCLTTTLRANCPDSVAEEPYRLYLALRQNNPAPYCAFFHLPRSRFCMLSSSPERFMRIDARGNVDMKPIKGTIARSVDPVIDAERRQWLERNTKDRAENLMIVDLARNDLLAFCDVATVDVPKFMQVESFQTVHQLVTTVSGRLSQDVTNVDAVTSAFPPGSMTGAPKLRSVRLLEGLERQRPRGAYSGAFGYFGVDGSADFSVVIRTLVISQGEVSLGAGGAITWLSDPESEWQEMLTKVDAVLGRKKASQ